MFPCDRDHEVRPFAALSFCLDVVLLCIQHVRLHFTRFTALSLAVQALFRQGALTTQELCLNFSADLFASIAGPCQRTVSLGPKPGSVSIDPRIGNETRQWNLESLFPIPIPPLLPPSFLCFHKLVFRRAHRLSSTKCTFSASLPFPKQRHILALTVLLQASGVHTSQNMS